MASPTSPGARSVLGKGWATRTCTAARRASISAVVSPKGSVEGARVEGAAAAADRATALADLAAMMAVTHDRYDSYTETLYRTLKALL